MTDPAHDATRSEAAERRVHDRLRAALPAEYRLYRNVPLASHTRRGGPAHDAEIDLLVVHAEHGLLVIEVKSGEPSRDAHGDWWLGPVGSGRRLERSPFEQAKAAKHDLVRELQALADWPPGVEPRAAHAVAFPEVDLASLPRGHALLGPDAPVDLVLDAAALDDGAATRRAVERAFAFWEGDGSRGRSLDLAELDLIDEYLAPRFELRPLLRRAVDADRDELVTASRAQVRILGQVHLRRAEVIGPAGSGKSMLAMEKARRLAADGYDTLLVCFNSPLAGAFSRQRDEMDEATRAHLRVSTFHRLCETTAERAGCLPPKPDEPPQDWWDHALPAALDAALDALPDERFHAIVVDEGQDFELAWLESLTLALHDPAEDVLWVFHDPGQALIRDDRVGELGLGGPDVGPLDLFEDYRTPAATAALAGRFYTGPSEPVPMREAGHAPRILEAEPGHATVDAVRRLLHELTVEDQVRPWHIVVLSGRTASASEVWRQRTFGNQVLWNGAIDDAGRSLRLPSDQVPDEPGDVVLFETIKRFKGLERPVVILCELPSPGPDGAWAARLDQLLYVGMTRATTALIIVAPPALAARLRSEA